MEFHVGKYKLYRFHVPVMDSNMYIMTGNDKALIIDPHINQEAEKLLDDAGVKDICILLTHEHLDHISGVNRFRDWANNKSAACTVYCNNYTKKNVGDPRGNLAEFFYALMIGKSEDEVAIAKTIFKPDYACEADIGFEGSMSFTWNELSVTLKDTPGHSPGCICIEIYESERLAALATGDSLVQGNKVITRLPNGNKNDYKNITRPYLESFPEDTIVLPGHGEISLMKELELG